MFKKKTNLHTLAIECKSLYPFVVNYYDYNHNVVLSIEKKNCY